MVGVKMPMPLQEPGDGRQDRGAPVFAIEQGGKAVTRLGCSFGPWRHELDLRRILRLAHQEPLRLPLRLVDVATRGQPVGALDDVEATECDEDGWNDRAREHPAPGAEFGKDREDEKTDRCSGERADGLEGECAEHELAALGTRNVFRNDHVRCRVIAAEREPEPEQENHDLNVVCGKAQRHEERHEDDHLGDEHGLAAETI
jgi:hypothetical protein